MKIKAADIIKEKVTEFLPDSKVLLFGSMARGDNGKDSDYDIMIITKNNIDLREKFLWMSKIRKTLIYALNAPVDVLLNSEEEIKRKRELPGHIVRWALKEGIML